jgi:hypothetical protein
VPRPVQTLRPTTTLSTSPTLTVPPPTLTVPPPTLTVPPPTLTVPPPTLTVPPPTLTVPSHGVVLAIAQSEERVQKLSDDLTRSMQRCANATEDLRRYKKFAADVKTALASSSACETVSQLVDTLYAGCDIDLL